MRPAKRACYHEIFNEDADPDIQGEFLRKGDFFNVQVSAPFPPSAFTVPCAVLLHDGERFMQDNMPNNIFPSELLHMLAPRIISYAKELVENEGHDVRRPRMLTFALYACVEAELPYEEREGDVMVPAAMKEAVAVSEEGAKTDCSSCKESEFVAVPCNDVFHKKCLETSNVCPLCGRRMHVEE